MAISVGTRIGSYEVVAPLGAGGMGEVYRGRDAKLGRDVALKILPQSFSNDPERQARFRREATLLASLNHRTLVPSPFPINWYDVAPGAQRFLVAQSDEPNHGPTPQVIVNWFEELKAVP